MRWYRYVPVAAAALAFAACGDNPSEPDGQAPGGPASSVGSDPVNGAAFTTTNPNIDRPGGQDGGTPKLCLHGQDPQAGANNCNNYASKSYVWFNGGPAAAALSDGDYFFAVLAPGGQGGGYNPNDGTPKNLSDESPTTNTPGGTPWTARTFNVNSGVFTYTGSPALHDYDAATQRIRLFPYDDTPNTGGVYIMALCRVPATPGTANPPGVNPSNCKYDAFRVNGGNELRANIAIEPDGVNGIGESHTFLITVTASGGTDPYDFDIDVDITPAGYIEVSNTCDTPNVQGDVATCEVTINSLVPGEYTATATATVTDAAQAQVTVVTDGLNGNSDPAVKQYVDGELTWLKVDDAEPANPLGGATFKIERVMDRLGNVLASDPTITGILDCEALPCNGADEDPVSGAFKVVGLQLGQWKITETQAPQYYALDPTPQSVNLPDPLNAELPYPGPVTGAAEFPFVNELIWFGETATGEGYPWDATRRAPSNWFMYTPCTTAGPFVGLNPGPADLIAGQHYDAGDITSTCVVGVGTNNASITITLAAGFRFAEGVSNSVKIVPMTTCSADQNYVQPGQFSVKVTPSSSQAANGLITVSGLPHRACYGIHVDVERNPLIHP